MFRISFSGFSTAVQFWMVVHLLCACGRETAAGDHQHSLYLPTLPPTPLKSPPLYGVWFGDGDSRNESSPLPVTDRQSITRAGLTAALRVLQNNPRCASALSYRFGVDFCRIDQ